MFTAFPYHTRAHSTHTNTHTHTHTHTNTHTHTQERLDRIDDILKSISQQLELILTEVCEQGFSLRLVLITFRVAG